MSSPSKYFRDLNHNPLLLSANPSQLSLPQLASEVNPLASSESVLPTMQHDINSIEKSHLLPMSTSSSTLPPIPGSMNANTVTIKENEELSVACMVNSSKPAANITIWVLKRPYTGYHRNKRDLSILNVNSEDDYITGGNNEDVRKLELAERNVVKNRDLTLRTSVSSRLIVNRMDNHKLITCVAENSVLNEKWETKRVLNVLYAPRCSRYQKTIYNTGINQTIELECHMTEANPPYLDFSWTLLNTGSKDVGQRVRSNGFISRISFTPRSEHDFGDIGCMASNGIDFGECKMRLQLGGPPNPPRDCYHKENNKTIIIECKPGFDQGDPEVYYYLLKKKSNGVMVEYARKRDSCSFLISNLILEEHMNEFFIYSSNRYGNNKESGIKITIENRELAFKTGSDLSGSISSLVNNRSLVIMGCVFAFLVFFFFIICCVLMKCQNSHHSSSSASSSSSILSNQGALSGSQLKKNGKVPIDYYDSSIYKYDSQYSSGKYKSSSFMNNKKRSSYEEKLNYFSEMGNDRYEFGLKHNNYDSNVNELYDNGPQSQTNSLKKKPFVRTSNMQANGVSKSQNWLNDTSNRIRSPSLVNSNSR